MSCYNPIPAVDYGTRLNKDGKTVRNIKLVDIHHRFFGYGLDDLKAHFGDSLILLPCGKCYGCSIAYSKSWASRIILETQFHEHNCFITLTYSDNFLVERPSKRAIQLFIKRLRKELDFPIRYFACGEIGEQKGDRKVNPHYHLIIFGFDFPDKVFLKRSHSGLIIYRSPLLEKLWPYGISSIGDVSPESAQYVAKYSIKRNLSSINNGEFVLMSRRPGIGFKGYDPNDYMTDKLYLSGHRYNIPRYFDKLAEASGSDLYLVAKEKRLERSRSLKSKKFQFNLAREEFSLDKLKEDRIRKDVLKVRNL